MAFDSSDQSMSSDAAVVNVDNQEVDISAIGEKLDNVHVRSYTFVCGVLELTTHRQRKYVPN